MACRLFGAKPLSKPMLGYCQLLSFCPGGGGGRYANDHNILDENVSIFVDVTLFADDIAS